MFVQTFLKRHSQYDRDSLVTDEVGFLLKKIISLPLKFVT